MNLPLSKIKSMLLYFATHTDPRFLGKVKLMKLFYFADFAHVKKYGTPITNDCYFHLEHGPVPSAIMNFVTSVEYEPEEALMADVISVEIREGRNMKRIIPQRNLEQSDQDYFSGTELDILRTVCERFKTTTGKEIEDISHKESAYTQTSEGESIPYILASNDPDCQVPKEDLEVLLSVL
jgi:uncharacterized phage-associated protein